MYALLLNHQPTVHCPFVYIYRTSRRECARLRENVPYVKVHRYNPKHLYIYIYVCVCVCVCVYVCVSQRHQLETVWPSEINFVYYLTVKISSSPEMTHIFKSTFEKMLSK